MDKIEGKYTLPNGGKVRCAWYEDGVGIVGFHTGPYESPALMFSDSWMSIKDGREHVEDN